MEKKIKLTIITPVFNSRNFIEKCIQNVIDQKCNFIEHLIIDAFSTDGTKEIIEKYAGQYSHIGFISEPDNGQSDAMNKGLKLAKGDYVGFLNADDAYMPFTLNRVLNLLTRQNCQTILVGNCKLVNEKGETLYINRPKRLKIYHFYSYREPYPINPVAYFYSKKIHNNTNVGYYNCDNHYNMDYEFFLRSCLYVPIIYFNEDWGYMLDHSAAKTNQDNQSGEMEKRKKILFKFYWKKLSSQYKIMSYLYIIKKRILR